MKPIFSAFFILALLIQGFAEDTNRSAVVHSGPLNETEKKAMREAAREFELQRFPLSIPGQIDSLLLCRQPDSLQVQLKGDAIKFDEKNPGILHGLSLQVWLLKTNGTCVSELRKPAVVRLPTPITVSPPPGTTIEPTILMMFEFARVPTHELAGLVVSVDGKLYCYGILKKNWQR